MKERTESDTVRHLFARPRTPHKIKPVFGIECADEATVPVIDRVALLCKVRFLLSPPLLDVCFLTAQ